MSGPRFIVFASFALSREVSIDVDMKQQIQPNVAQVLDEVCRADPRSPSLGESVPGVSLAQDLVVPRLGLNHRRAISLRLSLAYPVCSKPKVRSEPASGDDEPVRDACERVMLVE